MNGCWIGEVVGRHVDGLHGRNRAGRRAANAFLQLSQFRAQRRLISESRRQPSHQARHFRAGLNETEHVVDQQQHVLTFVVSEVFCHRQRRMTDTKPRAGRVVHLAEHEHRVFQFACFFQLAVQLFALAAALADAAEQADAFVFADRVVDQLHNDDGLADACTAE